MLVLIPKTQGRRFANAVPHCEDSGLSTLHALHVAIQNNRVDIVRQVLAIRERLITSEASRASALMHAVRNSNVDIVRFLVSKGTDLNRTSTDDLRMETPLFTAVRQKNDDIVQILLEAGASANIADLSSRTPLYQAVWLRSEKQARLLILHNANLHAADKLGFTPLHIACRNGDSVGLIALLLNHGANPNRQTNSGMLPIDFAIERRDLDAVQMLLQAGSIEGFRATSYVRDVESERDPVLVQEHLDLGIYQLLKTHRSRQPTTLFTTALMRVRVLLMERETRLRSGRSIVHTADSLPIPIELKQRIANFVGPNRSFLE